MPLVSADDFQKPAVTQPNMKVYQLALARMQDAAKPMPPSAAIVPMDRVTIMDWLGAGAIGESDAGDCDPGKPSTRSSSVGLKPRPGETCYDFQSHESMKPGDTTPYVVNSGEHYEQFYFKVPWPEDSVATRFGGKLDEIQVLHHWLLFSTGRSETLDGTHEASTGSQLGDDSHVLAGWALGGDDIEFAPDMGMQLPSSGMLNASWHYYNRTGNAAQDSSAVQVCVVNKAMREKIVSMSFLGTENLGGATGMPAHKQSEYSGTCQNRSGAPVTIWGVLPHMHKLGRHMKSVVTRVGGEKETIFDKPFDFNSQVHYPFEPMIVLQPGDRITSTCTFENVTDSPVAYGPSSDQEMCYQFTFTYPAGAIDNHVFSLTGDKNTCWGD